ncbi:hypothetical protein [Lutimonas zeaxanthinifaciens]|uniref:hypothetical protein n=1 Tax=Lutimonas zeaxanthinifaciens TaxID=3060215 RepID=UPI00265CCBF6|nr:hypothetical protein [Lutimonas sp. YSD2104]WKK66103.1 hypothetical protein QZH61_00415 [Lutimonas sp. YSD2104]
MKIKYYSKSIPGIAILPFLLLFLSSSCDTESRDIDTELADISSVEVSDFTEIENAEESIEEMTEGLSILMKSTNEKDLARDLTKDFKNRRIPDCADVSVETASNVTTLIIDFGDKCVTNKENVLSGKIIMTLKFNLQNGSLITSRTFENFYFNDKKMEGTVSKQLFGRSEGMNPYSTVSKDIQVTWKDDSYMTMTAEKKREWIEGNENMIWSNNVFLITGESSFQKKGGKSRSVLITKPLRREMSCKFIVSGTKNISSDKRDAVLDYGDGECDDLAYLTVGDTTTEIHIKRKKR